MTTCFHCETELQPGVEHPPWACLNNMTLMLEAERKKTRQLRNVVERAASHLLEGMSGLDDDLPKAFNKLAEGHSAAIKVLLALIAVAVMVGCGGSAFSMGEEDDGGGGDVVGTHIITTDAGAGESEAAAQVDATPETTTADAAPEAAPPVCLSTLSGVGTGDFHISFTLTTTANGYLGLVNQRAGCDYASAWWDVNFQNGAIGGATNSGPNQSAAVGLSSAVNDGLPHRIVVARTGGELWYSIDSNRSTQMSADGFSIGALPPLAIGTDGCSSVYSPLEGHGTLTDLCITSP